MGRFGIAIWMFTMQINQDIFRPACFSEWKSQLQTDRAEGESSQWANITNRFMVLRKNIIFNIAWKPYLNVIKI